MASSAGPADYRRLELEQLRASAAEAEHAREVAAADAEVAEALRHRVADRVTLLREELELLAGLELELDERSNRCTEHAALVAGHAEKQRELLAASEQKMASFEAEQERLAQQAASSAADLDGGAPSAGDPEAVSAHRSSQLPPGACSPLPVAAPSDLPREKPWLRNWGQRIVSSGGEQLPPRTLFGVGTTFLRYVDEYNSQASATDDTPKAKWRLVDRPSAASVVWMRDHLTTFEDVEWDAAKQQLNRARLPIEQALGNKANLARHMAAFYSSRPNLPVYVPETYAFGCPEDFVKFLVAAQHPDQRRVLATNVWIIKRADLASGFGHRVVPNVLKWFDAEKLQLMEEVRSGRSFVMQRYIANPRLLDGRKFDYRLYVWFATLHEPLRVLAADGYVRLSVEEFRPADFDNQRIHISNVAAGRTSVEYHSQGYAFFVRPFGRRLKNEHGELRRLPCDFEDWSAIRGKCMEAVAHVSQGILIEKHRELFQPSDVFASQLFGFDFTIDDGGNPWLTEVQICPALGIEQDAELVFMDAVELLWERLAKRMRGGESLDTFHSPLERLQPVVLPEVR